MATISINLLIIVRSDFILNLVHPFKDSGQATIFIFNSTQKDLLQDGTKASNTFPSISSNYPPSSPIMDGRTNVPSSLEEIEGEIRR